MRATSLFMALALPIVTTAAVAYLLRSRDERSVAPWRATALRVAVVICAGSVVAVEVFSALGVMGRASFVALWSLAALASSIAAAKRLRDAPARPRFSLPSLGILEWSMVAFLTFVGLATLVVALVSEPNNWDSQAYHLPKIAQWIQNGSVAIFPSNFEPQVAMATAGEYLVLHLHRLAGNDKAANLPQWLGGMLTLLAATRVAAQLGAGRFGQLATAVLISGAPIIVAEASSTQVDLIVSAWVVSAASFSLDAIANPPRWDRAAWLGVAIGLAWATKATGLVVSGLFAAMYTFTQLGRLRSWREGAPLAKSIVVAGLIGLFLAGPNLWRVYSAFDNPLGPYAITMTSMARHDPAAIVVNAARIALTLVQGPSEPVNANLTDLVRTLGNALGSDVMDPLTTLAHSFPSPYVAADEDTSGAQALLLMSACAWLYCMFFRRRDPLVLGYALTCLVVAIALAGTLRWQWYVTRLVIPGLAVVAPLAGIAFDAIAVRVLDGSAQRLLRDGALSAVLGIAALGGGYAALRSHPRPLYDPEYQITSVLTASALDTRFARFMYYRDDYLWATERVRASGARRVGLVINDLTGRVEYPLFLMLPGARLAHLDSVVPGVPSPRADTMDAIICAEPADQNCDHIVPSSWAQQRQGVLIIAFPPR